MDRTIVIYKSKYGATEKYAQWIGQELDCPVVSADDFNKKILKSTTTSSSEVVFMPAGVTGFDLIRKSMRKLAGKKVVVFAVGLNVMQPETRQQLRDINFSKKKVRGITCYYCPGAYDPSKVKGMDAMIMNMMKKMLEDKKNRKSQRTTGCSLPV